MKTAKIVKKKASKGKKQKKGREENTFRFTSFADYISKLGVGVVQFHTHLANGQNQSEGGTHLSEAVTKWIDLDHGLHFKNCLSDLQLDEIESYAQLLHSKDRVADCLLRHISDPESRSLEAVFELSMAFARDLRDLFLPFMQRFLDAYLDVVERVARKSESAGEWETSVIHVAFISIALLFKLYWRDVVKNLRRTFVRFSPLLLHARDFVRRFAAEAFAYVLRKSHAVGKLLVYALQRAKETGESEQFLLDGIAQLLFQTIRGVPGHWHSSAEDNWTDAIGSVLAPDLDEETKSAGRAVLQRTVELCAEHAKKSDRSAAQLILKPIENAFSSAVTNGSSESAASSAHLISVWLRDSASYPIATSQKEDTLLASILAASLDAKLHDETVFELLADVLTRFPSNSSHWSAQPRQIVENLAQSATAETLSNVLALMDRLSDQTGFDVWALPSIGKLASRLLDGEGTPRKRAAIQSPCFETLLEWFAKLCARRRPLSEANDRRTTFFDVQPNAKMAALMIDELKRIISVGSWAENDSDRLRLARLLMALPWFTKSTEVRLPAHEDVVQLLRTLISAQDEKGKSPTVTMSQLALLATRFVRVSGC